MFKVGDIIITKNNNYTGTNNLICTVYDIRHNTIIIQVTVGKYSTSNLHYLNFEQCELYSDYIKRQRKEKIKKLCLK